MVLPVAGKVTGAILSDQIKSLDWKARLVKLVFKAAPELPAEVIGKARALIG